MRKKRRNELVAGLFIIVSSGLFLLVLFMMGAFQSLFRAVREVKVEFEDVQGLRPGDPVELLGRKVGSVRQVQFVYRRTPDPARDGETIEVSRVLVTLLMPEKYWNRLKTDSRVVIDKTITGNLVVKVGEGTGDFLRSIAPGQEVVLHGGVLFDVEEATRKLSSALEKSNRILTELAAILDNLRESGHLQSIFRDIAETATGLRKSSGPVVKDIAGIAKDLRGMLEENRAAVRTTISSVASSSEKLSAFLTERLHPAADSLDAALRSAREAADSLTGIVKENRARVERIVRSLEGSTTSAETLVAEIRRRPWRLLYEPSGEELETLGLYDAAWAYNLAATDLHQSVAELASLSQSGVEVDPLALQRALDEVEANIRRERDKEEALYELLKEKVAIGK